MTADSGPGGRGQRRPQTLASRWLMALVLTVIGVWGLAWEGVGPARADFAPSLAAMTVAAVAADSRQAGDPPAGRPHAAAPSPATDPWETARKEKGLMIFFLIGIVINVVVLAVVIYWAVKRLRGKNGHRSRDKGTGA